MTSSTNEMTKIKFCGPEGKYSETLWATPMGGDLYRLDNSPFFAYGVSWQDVVEAKKREDDPFPNFYGCVTKSGNRTVRIVFEGPRLSDPATQSVLAQLVSMGCSYEGMQPRLASVNVPPEVDLDQVAKFLTSQPGLQWEHADPTYDELHP